eukprot:TRINITY_DN3753_c0_g1_i2.p1 TRINITY_DN3753_c0_g1~~TRINITY_DN3753_c0_g1_i2.p1  ORF type:complete len:495 (+),score=159.73 TRINITY_DN3753_c0_g1_i2:213-1487(+)
MTRGNSAWLREWLELQLLAGVDHVWVINDNPLRSADVSQEILKHYENLGYVTIIPGPAPKSSPGCEVLEGDNVEHMCAPVKHCFRHASPHVKWLMFADTDEFIYSHNGCSVSEHIKKTCNPDATHLLVRWERFGTSGHQLHPHGLVMENFLTSGGTCMCDGPFSSCLSCKKTKVIYNTECVREEHAGWPHDLVNTSVWKAEKKKRTWVTSEGEGSNFKKDTCMFRSLAEDESACNRWAMEDGFVRGYDQSCCAAGIGWNHYGTKSRVYEVDKEDLHKQEGTENLMGRVEPSHKVDLNTFVSFSVLRYLPALKKRMRELGISTSENVNFVETPKGRTCFVEDNMQYVRKEQTTAASYIIEGGAGVKDCCEYCHEHSICKAFHYREEKCTLLLDVSENPFVFPYQLQGRRIMRVLSKSGVPLHEKC